MSRKGSEIFNNYKRYLCVAGPRRSGKTLGVCDRVIRHAWETDKARVGVYVKYVKLATDGGCWSDLLQRLETQWIQADIGLKLVTPPRVDGATRQLYMQILNRHNTKSTFVLNSLDFDDNADEATKGKRYSMVWLNELSNFKKRVVFNAAMETLRCVHLPYEAHQLVADTNPAEEGEDSWIYKLFFEERVDDAHPDPTFRDELGLIEVMIEDNPFLTDIERINLIAQYRHDPDLYARYILGKWTRATTDSHFADVFRHDLHIIGDASHLREEEWEVLLPEEQCSEMVLGWDIGDKNHAISFLEPIQINGRNSFKLIDEVVLRGQEVGIGDVVELVLEKMDFWEQYLGRKLIWRHWSDMSAFDRFRPLGETFDAAYIYKYSEGRIELRGAAKFPNAVRKRITLTRRLLFEGRLLVSAKCLEHVAMFKGLRKGTSLTNIVDRASIHKHAFDSMTYAIQSELPLEFEDAVMPTARMQKPKIVLMR